MPIVDVLEAVAYGEACAEVVAAHGEIVGGGSSEGYGGEHEVVGEGVGCALPLGVEACSKTGGFGDDGEVAGGLLVVIAVVVDVFDVLIEADVKFPAVGQLPLDGANASADVEFAHGGVVGVEVDEGVDVEVVEGAGCLAKVEVVVVGAVVEADVEIGDMFVVALACMGMDGADVADVAVSEAYLEGVGLRCFFLASIEAIDSKHFSREDAMQSAYGIEEGADDFSHHTPCACLAVVEKDVGDSMGDFADDGSTDACGKQVVGGRTVGLAEEFPCERTYQGVEDGHAVGKSVLACGVVEHTAVIGMAELVT